MVEMQGDGSWTGRKTQTLLWSSILRPKCPRPRETGPGTRWSLQPDCHASLGVEQALV